MKAKKTLGMIAVIAAVCTLAACGSAASVVEDSAPSTIANPESTASIPSSASSSESSAQSVPESSYISTPTSVDNTPYTPPNNELIGEVAENIFVLEGGQGFMLYGMERDVGKSHAEAINKYKEALGEYVNVFSMIVPTQLSFYLPEKYSELSGDELSYIEDINGQFDGIIPIDVFAALRGHVSEDIYYRTDHHWTQLGAYYAAKAFAETALVPFDELSEYEKHEKDGYLGSFYGGSGEHPEFKKNPETFVWYIPKREVVTTYYDRKGENGHTGNFFFDPDDLGSPSQWQFTYMSGGWTIDGHIVRVNTGLDTGRRLMIIKDSYADAFTPCLFGSFDDIWVVDVRFCTASAVQLAKDNDITDVLFCCSANSACGDNRYKLTDIQQRLEEIM